MAKRQTRRSISVKGITYQRLKNFCEEQSLSVSGYLEDRNTYPWNYTLTGKGTNGAPRSAASCTLPLVSAGTCLPDSVRIYTPFRDPDATPIGTGNRYQAGANLSSGNEVVRYFVSGEREEETCTLELPGFELRRL